jgi:hypothetical protein
MRHGQSVEKEEGGEGKRESEKYLDHFACSFVALGGGREEGRGGGGGGA